MRLLFLFLSTFLSLNTVAQRDFISITNILEEGEKKVNGAFSLVNEKEKTFAIFINKKELLLGHLFSYDGTPKGSYTSKGLPKKYTSIIGQSIQNNSIRLFLKNKKNKAFGSILFDFEKGRTEETEFDLKLNGQKYLQSFSKNEKFYIITIEEITSNLVVYTFNHKAEVSINKIRLEKTTILRNARNQQVSLNSFLSEKGSLGDDFYIPIIYPDLPNTLFTTSSLVKMYPTKNGLILTLDKGTNATYLLTIDINKMKAELTGYIQPRLLEHSVHNISNSFLIDNNLLQLKGNRNELGLSITNIENNEIIKSYNFTSNTGVPIKNSPYYVVTRPGKSETYIDEKFSNKFLRATGSKRIGILATRFNDSLYQVSFGAYHPNYYNQKNNKVSPLVFGGGLLGGGLGALIAYAVNSTANPVALSFALYDKAPLTRVECLFNENFNPVEGRIKYNIFDIVKLHSKRSQIDSHEVIFKLDSIYVYGYFDSKNNSYHLIKYDPIIN